MSELGKNFERSVHFVLGLLPNVTLLSEAEIKTEYHSHISGVDHLVKYNGRTIYIQDKWEASTPAIERICQLKCDVDTIEAKTTSENGKLVIFVSKSHATPNGLEKFKEYGMVHLHNEDMKTLFESIHSRCSEFLFDKRREFPSLQPIVEILTNSTTRSDFLSVYVLLQGLVKQMSSGAVTLLEIKSEAPKPEEDDSVTLKPLFEELLGLIDFCKRYFQVYKAQQRFTEFQIELKSQFNDFSKISLKRFWDSVRELIEDYDLSFHSADSNCTSALYCTLKRIIEEGLRLNGTKEKKKYKWNFSQIKEIDRSMLVRSAYFAYQACYQDYGKLYWKEIGKLSIADLFVLKGSTHMMQNAIGCKVTLTPKQILAEIKK